MTIYIAIPTLEDSETSQTILEAFLNADNPEHVYIGVACFSSKKYFNELVGKVKHLKNVVVERYDFHKNSGVGIGRKLAMNWYLEQDYLLQVDSHTHFEKGWDSYLIDTYKQALRETQNSKTILTAYLGPYSVTEKAGREGLGGKPFFPNFCPGYVKNTGNSIPLWESENIEQPLLVDFPEDRFIPCPKFNANFAFGNREFAANTGLYEKSEFFEEEIIQTINLLGAGFSLVFPNMRLPLFHLYINEILKGSGGKRKDLVEMSLKPPEHHFELMGKNYKDFVKDPKNKKACQEFHKYTGVHPVYGAAKPWRIPSSFHKE